MADLKRQIDDILKQGGVMRGADWAAARAREAAVPRQPELPGAETPAPEAPSPAEGRLRGQHARLSQLRTRLAKMRPPESDHTYDHRTDEAALFDGPYPLERAAPGTVVEGDAGGFYLVRQEFPLDYRHGRVELGALLDRPAAHFAFAGNDEALAGFDPRRACFVDTETSGLAGGAGTIAFLVGVGYFSDDAFVLEQCFLRDYDDEEAMLAHVSGLFRGRDALVSYNGKSFDLPLLRSRFVQARLPFRLEGALHLDLVHAARRVWKRRLGDCSLGNVEREVLGIEREGDVPSFLIPSLWFNFMHTGDARPLEGVFYHHKTDILSLVALAAWLSQCVEAPHEDVVAHREDRLSIVRMHFRQGHFEDAARLGRAFLDAEPSSALRAECLETIAFAHKKLAQWDAMAAAWESLLAEYPGRVTALVELAKHHEHRTRDWARAGQLAREAAESAAHGLPAAVRDDLERRLARLERRAGGA